MQEDPAARKPIEVALLYSGVHAVWAHRVSHALWQRGRFTSARALSQAARLATGIEIHPGARLGRQVFIDHGSGVVIGETAVVGDQVTIYHGVTLGGTSLGRGHKRHPTIGDRVVIGAGAAVLGDITVGEDSRVGANSVLVRSVEPSSVVVGVPGQVVRGAGIPALHEADPDPVGRVARDLLARVERLEERLGEAGGQGPYRVAADCWEDLDYSI